MCDLAEDPGAEDPLPRGPPSELVDYDITAVLSSGSHVLIAVITFGLLPLVLGVP